LIRVEWFSLRSITWKEDIVVSPKEAADTVLTNQRARRKNEDFTVNNKRPGVSTLGLFFCKNYWKFQQKTVYL
jgi:hypothetical protein